MTCSPDTWKRYSKLHGYGEQLGSDAQETFFGSGMMEVVLAMLLAAHVDQPQSMAIVLNVASSVLGRREGHCTGLQLERPLAAMLLELHRDSHDIRRMHVDDDGLVSSLFKPKIQMVTVPRLLTCARAVCIAIKENISSFEI